ncbi:MAG TPA: hypothetical protein VMF89_36980 [Polyangiales bacterium]|nr:hypothetical protein [Polyangiales bacterium]
MSLWVERAALFATALLALACSVPSLRIEERAGVRGARDAGAADSGANEQLDAGSDDPRAGDSGAQVRTGEEPTAGTAAASGGGRSGSAATSGGSGAGQGGAGAAASAGSGGQAGTPAAGEGGAGQPMPPQRTCLVWTSINIRNGPPEGAIEGGSETIAGVTTRQYICRIRPAGSTYAIPGKYVDRVGCYIARRQDAQVMDVSVLDGLIDVLVPARGCTFSWRAASPAEIPANAVDLGDPPDGRNYACRGEYSNLGASGTQIGTIIPSTDAPPVNQCWFESFGGVLQPIEPTKFEVLVLDPL